MIRERDLTGKTILVVEDDYCLASDLASALQDAAAIVLGPCPSADAARHALANGRPTGAILDLNLGNGIPQFEIAYLLKAEAIPFLFLTGYDPDIVPDDMIGVKRLQKPVSVCNLCEAIGELAA